MLFSVAKAIHLGVFSLLAAVLIKTPYAIPAIAALWTGIERTHATFGFAWLDLGNAAIDMALPMRMAPYSGRLRNLVPVCIDGHHGRGVDPPSQPPRIVLAGRNTRRYCCCPIFQSRPSGTETAVAIQPNMSEDEQWTTLARPAVSAIT